MTTMPAVPLAATAAAIDVPSEAIKRYEVAFEQHQTASTEAESIKLHCETLEEVEAQIAELLRARMDSFPDATLGHNLYHYYEKESITLDNLNETLNCIPGLFDGGGVLTYFVQIPCITSARPTTIIYISVSDPVKVEEAERRESEWMDAYMASAPSNNYDHYNNNRECDDDHECEDEYEDDNRCPCGTRGCLEDCGTLHCGCIDVCRGRCEDYDSDY